MANATFHSISVFSCMSSRRLITFSSSFLVLCETKENFIVKGEHKIIIVIIIITIIIIIIIIIII